MPGKHLKDLRSENKEDDIKITKKRIIKTRGKKKHEDDIVEALGIVSPIVVERKKTNTGSTIDLRGADKERISGIRPDISGPDQRLTISSAIRTCWTVTKEGILKLPLWLLWLLGFVTLCFATLLFLFIFQYRLTHATYENYLRLSNLSQSQNVSKEIKDIAHDFSRLRKNFQIVNIIGNNPFVSHEKIATADAIIDGGTQIAFGMEKGYHLASELVEAFRDTQEITPLLEKRRRTIESISKHFHKAHDAYESIDSSSLDDLRLEAIFEEKRMQLQQASRVLASITDNYELFLNTLGHSAPQTILILNQNQDELRSGGGFPGSAAKLTLYKGLPESWELRDIYALDWSLLVKEVPPEGINQFRASPGSHQPVDFGIRDANYYPTFEESAGKINALMQEAGFGSVDMVVGVNQSLIIEILGLTGPIPLVEIDQFITAENFNIIISSLVESKTFAVNSPKDILFAFAEKLFEELRDNNRIASLANIAYDQIRTGEIIVASTHDDTQSWLSNLGIFELWREDTGDWMYPIFTSVSKNKSDRHMQREFTIAQSDAPSCLRTFHLRQEHAYDFQADAQIEKLYYDLGITSDLEALKHVQGKGDNRQFIRLLLPPGSELSDRRGYDLEQEVGDQFTQISWYQTTRTGHTSEVSFSYTVAADRCEDQTWMYKQPGLRQTTYTLVRPGQETESHTF